MTHGDMDEVDPEDAQTKLYQLSMQLAAAEEESNQMRSRSAWNKISCAVEFPSGMVGHPFIFPQFLRKIKSMYIITGSGF